MAAQESKPLEPERYGRTVAAQHGSCAAVLSAGGELSLATDLRPGSRLDPDSSGSADLALGFPEIQLARKDRDHRPGAGAVEPAPSPSKIGKAAVLHGADMLRLGFTIDQVVHDYGDVCQSVTDLAVERKKIISADEFRTLNRCLDEAIANAVNSFDEGNNRAVVDQTEVLHKRLNYFVEEQRRLIDVAIQSYAAIKTGNIGLSGATGTLLVHSLKELRTLADQMVPELRLESAKTILASS